MNTNKLLKLVVLQLSRCPGQEGFIRGGITSVVVPLTLDIYAAAKHGTSCLRFPFEEHLSCKVHMQDLITEKSLERWTQFMILGMAQV